MYRSKLDLLNMMKIWKLLLVTYCIMTVSYLLIQSLASFGIEIPLVVLISLLFFESMLIFVFTVVVVWRNSTFKL